MSKRGKHRAVVEYDESDSESEDDIESKDEVVDNEEEVGYLEVADKKTIEKPIEKTIFRAEFTGGYSIRQIFEFYEKLLINGIVWYFKEKEITIRTGTSGTKITRKLISNIDLNTGDIIDYYLDPDLVNLVGDEETDSCYVEQFNIDLVKTFLKSIGKTSSICFRKTTLDDNMVHVEIAGDSIIKTGIKSSKYQRVQYDISMFDDMDDEPNIKINMKQFCDSMKGMFRGNTGYTCFRVFPAALYLENCSGNGSITKKGHYGVYDGDPSEAEEDEYYEIKVNVTVMRALQKINGMAHNSIVKVTSEKNGYLRLTHKVGDFGEHQIYLIDTSSD